MTDENSKESNEIVSQKISEAKKSIQSDWEYKVALFVVTILAFLTRFYGISHPNQVVFDEVHFGKVRYNHISQMRSIYIVAKLLNLI